MTHSNRWSRVAYRMRALALAAPACACLAAPVRAQEAPAPSSREGGDAAFWGLTGVFGTGTTGGDFGDILVRPVTYDLSIFRQKGPWRVGAGLSFGSFKMREPYEDEQEWGFLQTYLSGTRLLSTKGTVKPYVQARVGLARLHPRSLLFAPEPLPEDLAPGESPTEAANGFSVSLVPGVEVKLGRAAALDASVSWTYFDVAEYDLSPVERPPASSGTSWEARIGATWYPNGGEWADGGERDAWGVQKSYGWAAAEVLAINNLGTWACEYIRGVNFGQVSPRSYWHNLEEGFTYDDNEFKTNQWVHPFNGAAYYNSGRANGLGFWPSAAFGAAGAFHWECCGETHPMSFNDLISTALGGIALGEAQFRLSSEILDNRATGKGRFFRELGAFLVDPIRGANRMMSGHTFTTLDNPDDPMDWRPQGGRTFLATGVRSIGEGSSITENTQTYATILLNHTYGDVWDNPRRKPFDYIDFVAEMNFGEKVALGNVQIRGDLASWPLDGEGGNHVIQIVQHFDYMNNTAYEFGGQSFGPALSSRFRLSDRFALTTRVDADAMVLGAVNSEYARFADVADVERFREYDYGPGLGTAVTAHLFTSGRPLLTALYRFAWISVRNGSVYNQGTLGSDADHYIQGGGLRLVVPVKGSLGIGADAYVFLRDSYFTLIDSATGQSVEQHIRQRNPQVRVYVSVTSG